MPLLMSLHCSTDTCEQRVDSEEELSLSDRGTADSLVWNGQAIERELYGYAKDQGWHWIGERWICGNCYASAMRGQTETAASLR